MQMITTASRLDWGGWALGIWTSAISGGAGAVASGIGPLVTDPKDFNLDAGLHHTLVTIGIGFAITSLFSLAKYLQLHPAPDKWNPVENVDRRGSSDPAVAQPTVVTPKPAPPWPDVTK